MTPRSDRIELTAAVAIASAGRPGLLGNIVENIGGLTSSAFVSLISVPDESSLPVGVDLSSWTTVTGSRGLSLQRNAALDALDGIDVVFFFDDDSVVRHDYVKNALNFFAAHPEIMGITGRVLLDGAVSGEIPEDVADRALADSLTEPLTGKWSTTRELYGCNFAVRASASKGLRFDGRLPLYSWLEDHDFARRLMRIGPLARVDDAVIVHRAASSGGRQAHTRLGYSQMMNPIYLCKKGSFPVLLAFREIMRPTSKNLLYSIAGPQRKWRRERLRGNLLAVNDAIRGRITPERITQL